jgi:hypothetical protein
LHEPPILIPPIPPIEALPVDEGIVMPVLVGAIPDIPDIAIEADVIAMLWSIFIVAG